MGTPSSTPSQVADLTFVLSSGLPLHSLQVPCPCPVASLKRSLRSILSTQLSTYLQASPSQLPPAALLGSVGDSLHRTKLFIQTMPLRLYQYGGNELKDTQDVSSLHAPICVLGGSDRVTFCCDIHGEVRETVYNLDAEVVWQKGEGLRSSDDGVIELVVHSTSSDVFLCSGYAAETVQSFKKRLSKAINYPENISLWYRNVLLEGEKTLNDCGLGNRSRIFVLSPGDKLVQVRDLAGRCALLPHSQLPNSASVCRAARILQTGWRLLKTATEYMCFSQPNDPHFFMGQGNDRFLSLEAMHGSSRVAIPAECTSKEVRACVESQHGLPASLLSLTGIVQVVESSAIGLLGLKQGDFLAVTRNLEAETPIRVKVELANKRKKRFHLVPSTTISQLKLSLKSRRAAIDSDSVLLRGAEVLYNEKWTLAEYGVFESTVLCCGSASEMREMAQRRREIVPSLLPSPPLCAESPYDLFDSGQILDRKSSSERFQGYLKALDSALLIRFITPKTVLFFYVLPTTTVKDLKSALVFKVNRTLFSLIWQDKALDDDKTLIEQGVKTGDTLLIEPIGAIRVNLALPAGTVVPIVLELQGNGAEFGHLVGKLTGLQANNQRIVYTRPLIDDNSTVSNAFSTIYVSVKLGKGRKHRFQIISGVVISVEADLSATPSAIEAELKRHGVYGEILS